MSGHKYHVFLSHASVDKPTVEELARWLVREGLTPFFDKWDLVVGEDWTDALPQALAESATCAVVIGPGDKGGWQTEEVKQSLLRRVRERSRETSTRFRIIPVLLPGASPPGVDQPSAFDFLAEYTWVKFEASLDEDEPRHRLVCGIRGIPPGPMSAAVIEAGACPYRSLDVFDVEHARLFFGREKLTRDVVELLGATIQGRGPRLLAVVGPSGSGKSSVVRAGLIPRLVQGALAGSETWKRLIFKPGHDPFENLGISLPDGPRLMAETRAFLGIDRFGRDDVRSLHTAARLATRDAPTGARLLVVVDQFEEVFTQCGNDQDRRDLIANLLHAATVKDGPTVVVLSLRADFLGKCAAYPELADAISGRTRLIGEMAEDELRWAIEKPAAMAAGEIEAALVEQLLREVTGEPGRLPLLEFALAELWNRKTGRRMTVDDYRAIGGLQGALKQHADKVLGALKTKGLDDIARRVFLDLIEPGKGTGDTRRRVASRQLAVSTEWIEVVETLVHERLVTTDRPESGQVATVEIVHEALIANWTTLQTWVDASRKSLVIQRDLETQASRWFAQNRHPDFLLDGLPLANALEWAEVHADDRARLTDLDEFLTTSQEASRRTAEANEESQRLRLEAAEATARRQKQLGQRFLAAAIVATCLAITSGGLAVWANKAREESKTSEQKASKALKAAKESEDKAIKSKTEALTQASIATSRQIASFSNQERTKNQIDRSLLLAVEAYRMKDTDEARASLTDALQAATPPRENTFFRFSQETFLGYAFNTDRKTLACVYRLNMSQDVRVAIWDATNWRQLSDKLLIENDSGFGGLEFSPDGKTIAIGYVTPRDGAGIGLWNLMDQTILRNLTLDNPARQLNSIAFSPDGQTLVAGYSSADEIESGVRVWNLVDQSPPIDLSVKMQRCHMYSVGFSSNGKTLAAGYPSIPGRGQVMLWNRVGDHFTETVPLELAEGPVTSVAFSPDDKTLAVGYDGQEKCGVVLYNTADRARIEAHEVGKKGSHLNTVKFSPDGMTLAAAYDQDPGLVKSHSRVALWDLRDPRRPETFGLEAAGGSLDGLNFSPDGKTIAARFQGNDTTIDYGLLLWNAEDHTRLVQRPLDVSGGPVEAVAYSSNAKIFAAGYSDSFSRAGITLWGLPDHGRSGSHTLSEQKRFINRLAFSPDGHILAAGYQSHRGANGMSGVALWSVNDQKFVAELPIDIAGCPVTGLSFSPDGNTLAARYDLSDVKWGVMVWDVVAQKRLTKVDLKVSGGPVGTLALSPDGRTVAAGYSGQLKPGGLMLWNVSDQKLLCDVKLPVPRSFVRRITFSPDGKTLATASSGWDGYTELSLWGVKDQQILKQVSLDLNQDLVQNLAFTPDGQTLSASTIKGNCLLWEVGVWGRPVILPLNVTGIGSFTIGADSSTIAVAYKEPRQGYGGFLLNIGRGSWTDKAGQFAKRNFTREESRQYFPDRAYQRTFDSLPEPPALQPTKPSPDQKD